MRILLTGTTGFIGGHLATHLVTQGYTVRAAVRRPMVVLESSLETAVVGGIDGATHWEQALQGVDAVVHAAGIAHADGDLSEDVYIRVNTDGTRALARACERAGVRRFVFLSSVRAQSGPVETHPLDETMPPRPTDAYGRSKRDAETGLATCDLEWIALRPVLVYGRGVKGNMGAFSRLARTHLPLPLGALTARRSLLSVDNLCEAVALGLVTQTGLRQAYLAADPGPPLTVPEMMAALREGLERPPGLLAVPPSLLRLACHMIGRSEAFNRLAGPLIVQPDRLLALGWKAQVQTRAGLAAWMRAENALL